MSKELDKRAFYVMDDPIRPVNKEGLKECSEALEKYKGAQFTVSHVASIHMTWEANETNKNGALMIIKLKDNRRKQ